ncbi:MAG: amidohydrolase [Chloroflexi bacterium]|nr:amidohydrolase [Chloroflexota bacterium]
MKEKTAMVIVDSHCHASPYWFEPVEVLLFQMDRNGVDKATLVQFSGQTDNSYILDCVRRYPGRFSAVVGIDTDRVDAPVILKQLVKQGAEGIRLRATTRSPGKDPLAIWRACAEMGLPVTCGGEKEQFASEGFSTLVRALPDLAIIIEHLGDARDGEQPPYDAYRRVLALSQHPNTYIKVGGLGEICPRPKPFRQPFPFGPVPPLVEMAYRAFGASRMLWGSNYPPSAHVEGYANTLHWLDDHVRSFCTEKDRSWIFGETALSLYKLRIPPSDN